MSSVSPPSRFLFGPGPTQIEARVYEAMAKPVVGYLDPYFFEINDGVRRGLREVFGTQNALTLAISGTGSAGMETAVSNFCDPGTKLLVFTGGFFADRIAEMGRRHGANVVSVKKEWGETFTQAEAEEAIERERPQVVAFVHGETSTGTLQDPSFIGKPAQKAGALVIADCVTSLGANSVRVDACGIDIAYSCTQKGLSCPPGLSPFTASERAVEFLKARKRDNTVWYLDLKLLLEYYDGRRYHHTAPISNFYGLHEGLAAIREEGAERRYARHGEAHVEFVRRVEAMGLKMHVTPGKRLPNLNTVRVPEGVDDAAVRKALLEEHGIEVGAGFGPLAGKIFRIGLMGPLANKEGLDLFFGAFEQCLNGVAAGASTSARRM
ncbi:MAG TPA: aminotransferase class V-fold PLP-dependent enzyme [Bryobacteraceae bacterium]|jgi:alanine-glyoxylate transaminase/serine-glyoxylate transaminase/serine-pyruvate transaminase